FVLTSGSSAPPVNFTLTDGRGNVARNLGAANFSNDVPGFAQVPLGSGDVSPLLGLLTAPTTYPYTLQLTGTGSGTVDLALTMPRGDGTFINGQISGVQISAGQNARIVLTGFPTNLTLQVDTAKDGTFATQMPISTSAVLMKGPEFLSANVIGPETLP